VGNTDAGVGFAGAFLNPFTVGIAQGIADLPIFSGIIYRIIVWFILTAAAIMFVVRYANRIKKNPEKSVTYKHDQKKRQELSFNNLENFESINRKHKTILYTFYWGF